ncbi:MAG: hypothetical protein A3F17_03780 [Gammaproteobacteria bacterium RIFCSPHIGHO2_12_FULL_41_15]|nr:MAG: hypothetical protein A3F17_03780 [Gammaproteobacteria bacterium RIFCSPHIGHO2_12_FULL_41_15]
MTATRSALSPTGRSFVFRDAHPVLDALQTKDLPVGGTPILVVRYEIFRLNHFFFFEQCFFQKSGDIL